MLSKNQVSEIRLLQQKKQRDKKKLFIAEGIKTVNEIVQTNPRLIKELFATEAFPNKSDLKEKNISWTSVSDEELKKISLQENPNTVLAVCHYFDEPTHDFDFKTHFSFYLDDIRDPGNFGTIIRLASWFGVSKVFCSPTSCDLYNPKAIQATMGAFLRVKLVYVTLEELLGSKAGILVYGALLNGKDLYRESLNNGLIVIGNEANGIREENLKHIARPLAIPSHPSNGSESLNAAMATSIIAAEFFRQLRL